MRIVILCIVLIITLAKPVSAVQDVTDVVNIMRWVLGIGGVEWDVNGDGVVNIHDVVLAQRTVLKGGQHMDGRLVQELKVFATAGATNLRVSLPLYYSDSKYVIVENVRSTHNFEQIADSLIYTIPEIKPGESETIQVEYNVMFNPINIEWSTPELDAVRQIYDKHKGSGNCRDLAQAFIADCEKAGMTAREVVGFVPVGDGCLSGRRHSWAEVSISGQWVPVDLTYKTFGTMTDTHIIEGYADRSISITSSGTVTAEWSNHWQR